MQDVSLLRPPTGIQSARARVLPKQLAMSRYETPFDHRNDLLAPYLQQSGCEAAKPGAGGRAVDAGPVELRCLIGFFIARIRNPGARVGRRESLEVRKLLAPPFPRQFGSLAGPVREEQERRVGRSFLTHEQHRNMRVQENQRYGLGQLLRTDQPGKPLPERAVADLVVVLGEED